MCTKKGCPRVNSELLTRGRPLPERRTFSVFAASGYADKLLSCLELNSVRAFFAGADTNEAVDVGHPDLSVADFAGDC